MVALIGKEGYMRPIGLPEQVARRNHQFLESLSDMDINLQNQALYGMWQSATTHDRRRRLDVSYRFLADLRHITLAVKRTQILEESTGFSRPH